MSKLLTKKPTKPKAPVVPRKYKADSSKERIYSCFLDGSSIQEILDKYEATLEDIDFYFNGGDQFYTSNEIVVTINLPVLNHKYNEQMEEYQEKFGLYEKKLETYKEKLKLWNDQKRLRFENNRANEIADLERKLKILKESKRND